MGAGASIDVPPGGEQSMVLKIYPLYMDIEHATKAIEGTIAPGSWGSGPSQGAIFRVGDRLLIRQTPAAHAQIQELLGTLQAWSTGGTGTSGMGVGSSGGGGMGGFF